MDPTYTSINLQRSRAKMNFQMRKHELAAEQAALAMQLFESFPVRDPKWDALCASLADLMQLMGRPDDCDRLMKLSLAACEPTGNERGTREAFYAKFLLQQGRLDEAEVHALAAIAAPLGEIGFAQELLRDIRARKT